MTLQTLIKEAEERFEDKFFKDAHNKKVVEDIKSFLTQSLTTAYEAGIQRAIEEIEKELGMFGSHSGSFGYQGIVMGIQSFQTPEDQKRDNLIQTLQAESK